LAIEKETKMKKWMIVTIVIGLVLALTACGSSQSSTAAATPSTALSLEGQLLVGTLKLESTSQAVSADQAGQLLPLWETLQSLASSGTAASQEVDAVVSQIESTMSAQQISSITAMDLTQQDLAVAIADAGASSANSNSANSITANSAQMPAIAGAPAAGDPGGGNPPADMGGSLAASSGAQSAGQTQTGSTQAVTSQSTGATSQVPAALIQALVELLQKKIA
jgi:hypothetical protein